MAAARLNRSKGPCEKIRFLTCFKVGKWFEIKSPKLSLYNVQVVYELLSLDIGFNIKTKCFGAPNYYLYVRVLHPGNLGLWFYNHNLNVPTMHLIKWNDLTNLWQICAGIEVMARFNILPSLTPNNVSKYTLNRHNSH